VTIETYGHDAEAYTKTYNKTPAETKAEVNAFDAAQQVKYRQDQAAVSDQYRTLTGQPKPVPKITSISPNTAPAVAGGAPARSVKILGSGFGPGLKVYWNGTEIPGTINSASEISTAIPTPITAGAVVGCVFYDWVLSRSNDVTFTWT
jgi:hypothetical protein